MGRRRRRMLSECDQRRPGRDEFVRVWHSWDRTLGARAGAVLILGSRAPEFRIPGHGSRWLNGWAQRLRSRILFRDGGWRNGRGAAPRRGRYLTLRKDNTTQKTRAPLSCRFTACATKSRTFHGREWMEHARGRWADLTNQMLGARGRDERVDHRSYARQGVDREPGEHYGPAAAHMVGRGLDHERLREAAVSLDAVDGVASIDREINARERVSGRLPAADRGDGSTLAPNPAAPERDEDMSRGRGGSHAKRHRRIPSAA